MQIGVIVPLFKFSSQQSCKASGSDVLPVCSYWPSVSLNDDAHNAKTNVRRHAHLHVILERSTLY